ncbi:MAG: inositol monophosphatase [Thermoanaerobaculia bacterium]|nr:inositol monophosphatase [Thermoanaerobaculia bacterium]
MADSVETERLVEVAIEAAHAGAAVLRRFFRHDDLQVHSKGDHDFVTKADHESEEAILGVIRSAFPDHHALAEESGHSEPVQESDGDEYQWIIDPLDGTSNFLQGVPMFCISIACRRRGQVMAAVVYEPIRDDLFSAGRGLGAHHNGQAMRVSERLSLDDAFLATGYPFRAKATLDAYLDCFRAVFLKSRGIRRVGAAALDLAYTAAGIFDGFFEFRLSPWDIAAGALLVEEAGGKVTDLDGMERYLSSGNVLAGPPGVHTGLLEVVGGRVSEDLVAELEE